MNTPNESLPTQDKKATLTLKVYEILAQLLPRRQKYRLANEPDPILGTREEIKDIGRVNHSRILDALEKGEIVELSFADPLRELGAMIPLFLVETVSPLIKIYPEEFLLENIQMNDHDERSLEWIRDWQDAMESVPRTKPAPEGQLDTNPKGKVIIEIFQILGHDVWITQEDGNLVHAKVVAALRENKAVIISFAKRKNLIGPFLNAVVGQLYNGEFTCEFIRDKVEFTGIDFDDEAQIARIIDNAKEYYAHQRKNAELAFTIDNVPTSSIHGLILAPAVRFVWKPTREGTCAEVTFPNGTVATYGIPEKFVDAEEDFSLEDRVRRLLWKDLEAAYLGDNATALEFYKKNIGEGVACVFPKADIQKVITRLYLGGYPFTDERPIGGPAGVGELVSFEAYRAICKDTLKKLVVTEITLDGETDLTCKETKESFCMASDERHGKKGIRIARYVLPDRKETVFGYHGETIEVAHWDESYLFYPNFAAFERDFQMGDYTLGRQAF